MRNVGLVAVRDFRDLICWQLSYELKCEVLAFTDTASVSKDFEYCDQIRNSSASAPRNVSDGFGRFTPGEFAQYLKWARASLMETQNHLIDGRDRRVSGISCVRHNMRSLYAPQTEKLDA